jgi:hypothetical protein
MFRLVKILGFDIGESRTQYLRNSLICLEVS